MAGITGNIIVSTTDTNVSVQEGNVANIIVTEEQTNITLVAGSVFFPYDNILRDLIPGSNGVLTLGNATNYWDSIYVEKIFAANDVITYNGNLTVENGEFKVIGPSEFDGNVYLDRSANATLTGNNSTVYSTSLFPHISQQFDLGNSTNVWSDIHVGNVNSVQAYHGYNSGADANVNPLRANAITLNATSILHRGNALIFDSAQGASTSDEKTVITSGGTEGPKRTWATRLS